MDGYEGFLAVYPECNASVRGPTADDPEHTVVAWDCSCGEPWSTDVRVGGSLPTFLVGCDLCGRLYAFDGERVLIHDNWKRDRPPEDEG